MGLGGGGGILLDPHVSYQLLESELGGWERGSSLSERCNIPAFG